MTWNRE